MDFMLAERSDREPVFPDRADNDPIHIPLERATQRASGKPKPGDFISSFAKEAMTLLKQIEYRPVTDPVDLEQLYRFRYDCYLRDGHVLPRADGMLRDRFDFDPQAMRFGVWMDGKMVSAIRLQRMTPERRIGVSMLTFPDILNPMFDAGCTFIDPSRLITDRETAREHPHLAYLTVRLAAMAALHFETDYLLSMIRPRHGAFYRRLSMSRPLSGVREYPGVEFGVQLFASDARRDGDRVLSRFPAFHSLSYERRMLFGDPKVLDDLPADGFTLTGSGDFNDVTGLKAPVTLPRSFGNNYLTVLPTADLATRGLPVAA